MDEKSNEKSSEHVTEQVEPRRKLPEGMEPYKWQPGQSGNPGGRPKRKPISELYERILDNPENIELFEKAVIKAVASGRMSSMFQLKEMADRTEGKVKDEADITLKGDVGTVLEAIRSRKHGK